MAKRLSEKQKDEIVRSFTEGKNIDILSSEFNCNKLTISRNLKKYLGEKKYKDLIKKNKLQNQEKDIENSTTTDINKELYKEELINKNQFDKKMQNYEDFNFNKFTEITPLDEVIDNNSRKDFSSIPIEEIDLPKIVYMIVSVANPEESRRTTKQEGTMRLVVVVESVLVYAYSCSIKRSSA